MKPIKNKILIDPIDELDENFKKYGISTPDHDNVLPYRGKVLSVGSDVKYVKKGDTVIFDRFRVEHGINGSGHKIKYEDKEYILMPENLVFAKYDTT